ncbi:dickkopf-related protein 3-like [Sinocyclocheilus grahami]|uniref:dickkopf-related protein 3-like n=1 Tax=Sinocyclocheilus grahami TaxID=75366 RepID=UPI0007AC8160|nr:PREDICTED: dickkopf-related protein 3-like [Sinocyclocheilus grahami]
MFLLGFSLCLAIVYGIVPEISKTDMDIISNMVTNVEEGQTPLSDMFREVEEELMEDTQQKLEDAVQQMDNETAKSSLHPHNVSANLRNYSMEIIAGNQSIYTAERINKTTDNSTEVTHNSTTIQPRDEENSIDHTCTKDEECCVGQLCVWGQCADGTKGDAGTICQSQSDCKKEFCCAYHKALLLPVCNSKPIERERCIISANHLIAHRSWDLKAEGPQKHCPCAGDLQCQHLG